MLSPETPPVFVLGCHRSGTSVVTGLLAEAGGLYLGDVLPPDPANPRGYFESTAGVLAHNRLLAAMDRDWTCPPASFDPGLYDLDPLATLAADLSSESRLWGLKDPRTLFLLPAWTSVLERVRLVGVTRDTSEITKSIIRRDGIPPDAAAAVVDAYQERLAAIAEEFNIPVVDFSGDPQTLIGRTRAAAESLELGWDDEAANRLYSTRLVHHAGRYATSNPAGEALRAAAGRPIDSIDPIPADRIRKLVDGLQISAQLRTDVGPRHNQRRAELLRALPGSTSHRPVLELTTNTDPASSMKVGGDWITSVEVEGIEQAAVALTDHPGAGQISLASIADRIDDADLERLLSIAATFSAPAATAVVDFRDRPAADAVHPVPAFPRDHGRLGEIAQAAGWGVKSVEDSGFDRSVAVLVKHLPDDPLNRHLIALRATLTAELEDIREEIADGLRGREEQGSGAGEASATGLEAELAATRWQLERLRNRRSVRFATRIASFFKPLFRRVRSVRRR